MSLWIRKIGLLWLMMTLLACGSSRRNGANCPTVAGTSQQAVVCPDGASFDRARGVCVRTRVEEQVTCPGGSTWSGSACTAQISTTCPGGMHFEEGRGCLPNLDTSALAASDTRGGAASFGTEGVRYSWGSWTLTREEDEHVYLWYGSGNRPVAIEMIGASNGWWRYAGGRGGEHVVWSNGSMTEQSMDRRPWLSSSAPRLESAPVVGSMAFGSVEYHWNLAVDHDVLRITTSDGQPIELRANSDEVSFDGKTIGASGGTSGGRAAFGTAGTHYRVGKWTIARVDDGNVYLWYGTGAKPAASVELIAESNGWWRYGDAQNTWVVWSAGGYEKQFFYNSPWKDGVTPEPAPSAAKFEFGKGEFDWSLKVDGGRIEIVTSDGESIVIDANKPTVTFKGSVVKPK